METVPGPAGSVDQELLKVPPDVVAVQRLVEEFVLVAESLVGRRAGRLEVGEDGQRGVAVDLDLLGQREEGLEGGAALGAGADVAEGAQDLGGVGARLLQAELQTDRCMCVEA